MRFVLRVSEEDANGCLIPRGYGLAYRQEFWMVLAPIPINVLWRVWRELWWHLQRGGIRRTQLEKARAEAYAKGHKLGFEVGKRLGHEEGLLEARRRLGVFTDGYLKHNFPSRI